MIAYHVEKGADITVGVVEVPASESRHFGVLTATEWNRVTQVLGEAGGAGHAAGPARTRSSRRWASTSSTRACSRSCWPRMRTIRNSAHDFGKNIMPKAIAANRQVFAYPFQDVKTRAQSYWRDVGTLDAYYEANLELVHVRPGAQHLRRGLAHLDLPGAPAAGEVHPRRGRAARHGRSTPWSPAAASSPARWCASRCCSPTCASMSARSIERSVDPAARRYRHAAARSAAPSSMRAARFPTACASASTARADAQRFHVTENGVVLVTPDMLRRLHGRRIDDAAHAPAGRAAVAHAPAAVPRRAHRPVRAAVDLPARHQGLHRHGRAPGGQPGGARGGQLHAGAARAARGDRAPHRRAPAQRQRRCRTRCSRCSGRIRCRPSPRSAWSCCAPACGRSASR